MINNTRNRSTRHTPNEIVFGANSDFTLMPPTELTATAEDFVQRHTAADEVARTALLALNVS
jgi:hypothetical protein